jgi:hypothetical protein
VSAVELKAPLPDGDLEARLTWREKRSGPLPDRDADRAGATHATLWTRGLGGRTGERTLTLEEADAYLEEAGGLRGRMDERLDLLAAGAGEHVAREEGFQFARPQAHGFEHYVCPRCGSAELFAAGALDHPLPGSERS